MRKLAHETLGVQKHAVNPEDYWAFKPGEPVVADGLPGKVTSVQDGPVPGNESYLVELDGGAGGGEYTAAQLTRPGSMTSEAINLNFHKFQVGDRVIADGLPGYISFVHQDPQAGAQFGTVQTYTVTLENGLGQHLFSAPQLMKTAELESEAAGPVVASYWYPELGSILVDRIPNEQLQVTAGLRRTAGMTPTGTCKNCGRPVVGNVANPSNWVHQHNDFRWCRTEGDGQKAEPTPESYDPGSSGFSYEQGFRHTAKVHFNPGHGGPACGAGAVWDSVQLSTTKGTGKVDCASCQRTKAYQEAAKQHTASHADDAVDWHQFDSNGAYRWGAQDGMKGETAERDASQARVDVQRHDQHDIDYLVGHEHGTERGRRLAEGQHTVNQMVERAPEYNSVEHQVDMLGHELRHEGATKYPYGHVNGVEITDHQYPGESGIIQCDNCGKFHSATPDHVTKSQGQIHSVVCPQDQLTDYYTDERLQQRPQYPARGSVRPSKFGAAVPPDDADVDDSMGEGDAFDSKAQPDVCSFCGNPGPWTDQQDTGRGTRVRCGTCGGTMRLNQDEVAGTSGIQWQPEFPNSPQNAASGAGDPRATTNDLAAVHSALNPAASQQAGHVIFHAPELADALLQITAAEVDDEFRFHFTASWFDVRKKATRIRQEDGVRITGSSPDGIIGEVRGDNGVYESAINWVPGTHKVAIWACGCKWGAYAWGRAPQYKRFEGRQCSHVLALQFEAQSRGMFGREVHVDEGRMDGQHQRTPVTVQYQRPTDRHPGGNINRRTVPPGNVRTEWGPDSRVRVKGSLTPAHDWARTAVAVGIGPGMALSVLHRLGIQHQWAREVIRYATSSPDSTLVSVEGSLHQAIEIEGDSILLDDGRMVHSASVALPLHIGMSWSEHGGMSAEQAGAKSVRHAGFRGYVGREDSFDDFGDEGRGPNDFDEDLYDKVTPEPTHEEQAHYDEHGEYPESHYERHDRAYGEAMDAKNRENDPDIEDEHLHHFISEHGSDAEEWRKHGPQPIKVDLRNGVWATQSHVGQTHIDKYLHDPSAGVHQPSYGHDYLGDKHAMFVTHEGRLHAIEGHHRVAAELQRGSTHMDGWHYDLDKHPVASDYHHEPCETCQDHAGESAHHYAAAQQATADEDGGDIDPAASIPGIYNRDQTDRAKKRKHLLHHTNDAREHAHNFGYGLPWGGVYAWCEQCQGSGCGHCGGTGQVAVGTGLPQNASDASTTENPVPSESADAGPMVGDSGGGMSATGVVSRIHLQAAATPFPGPTLCGAVPDADHPNYRLATVVCEACAALAPAVGDVTERRMIHEADYSSGDLGPTYPAETNGQKTPTSNSPNPGSTGFATSADPSAWVNPVTNSGFDARWASIRMTASGDTSKPPVAAGVALKAADTGRVLMIQRSNKDQKDPARGRWEFPGGHREDGDTTSLHAAVREFEEEVGQPFPPGGHLTHVHRAGPYVLHTVVVPKEDEALDFTNGRSTVNPDDPDGDDHEQSAWWDPEHARKNPALRDEAKSNPWGDIKKAATYLTVDDAYAAARQAGIYTEEQARQALRERMAEQDRIFATAEKWTMTDQDGGGHGELPERPRYVKPNGIDHCLNCGDAHHDLSPSTGHCPTCSNNLNEIGDPHRRDPTGGSTHAWYTQHGMDPDHPITGLHEDFSMNGWMPHEHGGGGRMHTLSATHPMGEDEDVSLLFSGTLHDEPEPALPSTDGAAEEPAGGPTPWPDVAPGVGTERNTPWGYPEQSAPEPQVSDPGSADVSPQPSAEPSGIKNESSLTVEMRLAAQFNPVLAAFQQTAAFQEMAQSTGGAPDDDAKDVAAAARAHLAKLGAKNFSFAEQQELIGEGGGTVRARNLADLRVEGTHYERLGDEERGDDEWLML